ncbi:curli production assembly/transport component CsgG [Stenotrophomonas rhizophila]|uniref:CsgG/HfaB family protein n=1 Tax=Stenotrophomonas rhizophila TaxID=216778 RepID=UPI000F4B9F10|nr:CsgG/HfaB family protein [Stenotrophomonas rhizophila]ROP73265.1 curli production assembly/transport component CsgG [Stenotrophomonas rhizophila]
MQISTRLLSLAIAATLLAACGKREAPVDEPASKAESKMAATAPADAEPLRGSPDFGGTTQVAREADGIGSTPELAVLAALQSAVAQVNGVRVASQMQTLRAGLDVDVDGHHVGSIDATAFAQQAIAASQGAVLGYEILSQEEISQLDEEVIERVRASDAGFSYSASASASGSAQAQAEASGQGGSASASVKESYKENAKVDAKRGASSYESDVSHRRLRSYWKVRIRADIAKYRAPDEQGRPKIVVALPHVRSGTYAVGDGRVSSEEVARAIRARLSDTLTQTKRFIVLDREFGDEMQAEIDHINSGNVRLQDTARLGQQLATDLILIPSIERFEYPRSVRQLRMSDRQVSSYSGGGRITLRLINAATGEVVMSDSFDHQLASTGPSTLPRVVDGKGMAATMMDSLSGQIGTAIITEIFPVSVVSMRGDQVVLSQGGESLQVGQRWQAVMLGEALKDPQTGRSLGRNETPCCTIRIDRVAAQTSYGTIEAGADLAGAGFRPGAIELRRQAGAAKPAAPAAAASGDSKAPARAARPAAAAKPAAPAEDPNW